jgi:tetratricopeptide (TPR) repeat protein
VTPLAADDAQSWPALNNLGVTLQRSGRLEAAEARYRQALSLAPDNSEIQVNLAAVMGARGNYPAALKMIEQVLAHNPGMLMAHLLASALERGMGRLAAALSCVERALALAPEPARILSRRAEILCLLGRCQAALEDCDQVLATVPNDAGALHVRALALQNLNRPVAALEAYRLAETAATAPAGVIADRAWLLAETGRTGEALQALRQALERQPDLSIAWYRRAYLRRYAADDPDLAAMQAIADNPDSPYPDRLHLSFALGKAYLDLGDGNRAFARLDTGNRMKRALIDYDPDADARLFAQLSAAFSAETLGRYGGCADASIRPIFVFGMPRSGTTLVEQILASHGLVHGSGESTHLRDVLDTEDFEAWTAQLTPADCKALGRRYLDRVGLDVPEGLRLVDKTPMNFRYAGAISLILPGARMIHCRRDALDTCLSCYSLLFVSGHEFAYDQIELGRFYRLYQGLMAHWRRLLPAECLLEINYEALVSNTEGEVRRILDFCALPWDAACLRFHDHSRRVSSASLEQVRSPVYTTSVGRARSFRPWLGPLALALGEANA